MVTLVLVLLLLLVVGLAVAVTVGFVGGGLPRPATDVPPPIDGPVREPVDLDRARFQLAFRGYRMDQVDRVLDDARDALAARDEEIARLRAASPEGAAGPASLAVPDVPEATPPGGATAVTGVGDRGPAGDRPEGTVPEPADSPFRRPTGDRS